MKKLADRRLRLKLKEKPGNRAMKKIIFILLFSCLLQSCFVARKYERPQLEEVTAQGFRTDELPQDSVSMAEVSWRELFTDPVLVSHLENGLENNIDIRIALQQILAAEAYVRQGRAAFLPSLTTNGGVTHQNLSRNSQFGRFFDESITQYELAGTLSWEADIWGRIRSSKRAFEAGYLQSVAAHQAVKTQLIAGIATTYYQLQALDEQVRITRETIATREKGFETTQALKQAGIVTEVGVKQTEAQIYAAQGILIDLLNETRLLENALSILLGQPPGEIGRGAMEEQAITTDLSVGVPANLLRNRPDVMAAEYGLINAFELTNMARSEFYPSLRLTATGGLQSLELDQLLDVNSFFATIVGSIAQPVFNQRRIRTAYEVSKAEQEQALLNFKRSLLIASGEVSDALYNHQAARDKIAVKLREYEAYDLAASYSEELLDNGMVNYLEVLTARENTLTAQLQLVNARFNRLQAIVELYQALGGGWQ